MGDKPIKVKTSSFIRIHPKSTHADAKITGHYINSLLAAQEAHAEGYDEALLLDWEGFVAEGPGENVFAVKDGVLYTPPLGAILPGITRDSVITIARDLGIEVRQMTLTPQDLRNAEELFFTGTAVEVAPIGALDDKTFGPGPVTARLRSVYSDAVHGKAQQYRRWLTIVR